MQLSNDLLTKALTLLPMLAEEMFTVGEQMSCGTWGTKCALATAASGARSLAVV